MLNKNRCWYDTAWTLYSTEIRTPICKEIVKLCTRIIFKHFFTNLERGVYFFRVKPASGTGNIIPCMISLGLLQLPIVARWFGLWPPKVPVMAFLLGKMTDATGNCQVPKQQKRQEYRMTAEFLNLKRTGVPSNDVIPRVDGWQNILKFHFFRCRLMIYHISKISSSPCKVYLSTFWLILMANVGKYTVRPMGFCWVCLLPFNHVIWDFSCWWFLDGSKMDLDRLPNRGINTAAGPTRGAPKTRWWQLKCFLFHPDLEKIPILTNIFQMGWNHQLDLNCRLWTYKLDEC